jgi:hypothetical protein
MLTGATLVMLAALSPWALMRLLPLHEIAGAAAGGLRPGGGRGLMTTAERADVAADVAGDLPRRLRALAEPGLEDIAPGDAPAAVESAPLTGGEPREAAAGPPSSDGVPEASGDAATDDAVPGAPHAGRADERPPMPEVLRAPSNSWRTMDLGPEEFRSGRPLLDNAEEADPQRGAEEADPQRAAEPPAPADPPLPPTADPPLPPTADPPLPPTADPPLPPTAEPPLPPPSDPPPEEEP